jgi:hypothetical protein
MDIVRSLAKKVFDKGNDATSDFVQSHFPEARTIGKKYADRKLRRMIECEDGSQITVIYDYTTQTVAVDRMETK